MIPPAISVTFGQTVTNLISFQLRQRRHVHADFQRATSQSDKPRWAEINDVIRADSLTAAVMVHVPSGGNQIPVTDSIFWSILAVLQGSRLEATVAFSVTRSAWRGGTSSGKPPSPASLYTACFYHCEQNDVEWLNDFLFFFYWIKLISFWKLSQQPKPEGPERLIMQAATALLKAGWW